MRFAGLPHVQVEGAFFGDGERRSVADGVARLRFTTFGVLCRVGVDGCSLVVYDRDLDWPT